MSRCILHHAGRFFEWSTVSDGAVTPPMELGEFIDYYRGQHGAVGMNGLDARLERAMRTGTSMHGQTFEDVVSCNRMGLDEAELTAEEIKQWAMS